MLAQVTKNTIHLCLSVCFLHQQGTFGTRYIMDFYNPYFGMVCSVSIKKIQESGQVEGLKKITLIYDRLTASESYVRKQ